jgi:glycosyltransferase involved in cell wall biosynthesis
VILGVVDDLTPVYASARMAVNPVRFSTGLSIKSIEALGYAMPLVTTTAGAAGLAGKLGPAAIVADDDREFAGAVVRLLKDDAAVAGMSRAAHAFSLAWNRECITSLAALIESGPPP